MAEVVKYAVAYSHSLQRFNYGLSGGVSVWMPEGFVIVPRHDVDADKGWGAPKRDWETGALIAGQDYKGTPGGPLREVIINKKPNNNYPDAIITLQQEAVIEELILQGAFISPEDQQRVDDYQETLEKGFNVPVTHVFCVPRYPHRLAGEEQFGAAYGILPQVFEKDDDTGWYAHWCQEVDYGNEIAESVFLKVNNLRVNDVGESPLMWPIRGYYNFAAFSVVQQVKKHNIMAHNSTRFDLGWQTLAARGKSEFTGTVGENLAAVSVNPSFDAEAYATQLYTWWYNSPIHYSNMIDPDWTDISGGPEDPSKFRYGELQMATADNVSLIYNNDPPYDPATEYLIDPPYNVFFTLGSQVFYGRERWVEFGQVYTRTKYGTVSWLDFNSAVQKGTASVYSPVSVIAAGSEPITPFSLYYCGRAITAFPENYKLGFAFVSKMNYDYPEVYGGPKETGCFVCLVYNPDAVAVQLVQVPIRNYALREEDGGGAAFKKVLYSWPVSLLAADAIVAMRGGVVADDASGFVVTLIRKAGTITDRINHFSFDWTTPSTVDTNLPEVFWERLNHYRFSVGNDAVGNASATLLETFSENPIIDVVTEYNRVTHQYETEAPYYPPGHQWESRSLDLDWQRGQFVVGIKSKYHATCDTTFRLYPYYKNDPFGVPVLKWVEMKIDLDVYARDDFVYIYRGAGPLNVNAVGYTTHWRSSVCWHDGTEGEYAVGSVFFPVNGTNYTPATMPGFVGGVFPSLDSTKNSTFASITTYGILGPDGGPAPDCGNKYHIQKTLITEDEQMLVEDFSSADMRELYVDNGSFLIQFHVFKPEDLAGSSYVKYSIKTQDNLSSVPVASNIEVFVGGTLYHTFTGDVPLAARAAADPSPKSSPLPEMVYEKYKEHNGLHAVQAMLLPVVTTFSRRRLVTGTTEAGYQFGPSPIGESLFESTSDPYQYAWGFIAAAGNEKCLKLKIDGTIDAEIEIDSREWVPSQNYGFTFSTLTWGSNTCYVSAMLGTPDTLRGDAYIGSSVSVADILVPDRESSYIAEFHYGGESLLSGAYVRPFVSISYSYQDLEALSMPPAKEFFYNTDIDLEDATKVVGLSDSIMPTGVL